MKVYISPSNQSGNPCPRQFTSIVALPNCVLFLTDSVDIGVWKWNRLSNPLVNGMRVEIEPAYIVYDDYPGNEPIGVRAGVTYGANAVAYFAWQFYDADSIHMPSRIFATTDGNNFHTIWQAVSCAVLITAGKRIRVGDALYRASVDLWDNSESTPEAAPNLWTQIILQGEYRVIPEVITAELAFAKGEIGIWKGKNYRAKRDGVVHNPEVYPGDWEEV